MKWHVVVKINPDEGSMQQLQETKRSLNMGNCWRKADFRRLYKQNNKHTMCITVIF